MSSPEKTKEQVAKEKEAKLRSIEEFNGDECIPFSLRQNGKKVWYCVGHMSGLARDEYMKELTDRSDVTQNEDGSPNVKVKSFDGMSTMLLRHCVYGYTKNEDGSGDSTGVLVTEEQLRSFPAPVLDTLTEKANLLNAMGDTGVVLVKND